MPRRRDDDYDDWDDDQPRGRRGRDRDAGGGFPVTLWVGLGVGAIVVIGAIAIFVTRSRNQQRDQVAAERAAADQARAVAEAEARPRPGGPAWPRLIGVWERPTRGKTDTGYHFRFEFRADMTGTMTRLDSDGNPLRQDVTVEILSDGGDTARLRLLVPKGLYGYTFTLKPDGTMVLDDQKGGLVFTRAE